MSVATPHIDGAATRGVLDEEGPARRSWLPIDLDDVLSGRCAPIEPTVGVRGDGVGLFYRGRMHVVMAEPEGGKTWLGAGTIVHELLVGNAGVFIDFEDDEVGVVGRLLDLGLAPQLLRERFAYIRPEETICRLGNEQDLAQALGDLRPSVVILDGVTEAMALHGLDPLSNRDVATFGKLLPSRIAATGPAVVALDHVVKDRENRGRWAMGGQHKIAGLNGAAYALENRVPFGVDIRGRSTLRISKDRPGQLRRHALPSAGGLHWFGDLVVDSTDQLIEVTVDPPEDRGDDFRPTVLMARVADALAGAREPLTQRGVLDRVTGKQETVRRALAALVDEGFVEVTTGPRNATLHNLVKPFEIEVKAA